MHTMNQPAKNWRNRLYHTLFDINDPIGRWVEWAIIAITIWSVITVFVESTDTKPGYFSSKEMAFTLFFTVEYILRFICTPRKQHYPLSFFGIIDLLTLLPIYIIVLIPSISNHYAMIFRVMRVIRILRMLKFMRYMGSVKDLWQALVASYRNLMVFFFIIAIIIMIFAGIMYIIEGPVYGFTNLPVALYWSVVTVTTVGYGDITPHTAIGRAITSILILIGYGIIAIPTGIITSSMTEIMQRKKKLQSCQHCHHEVIEHSAHYCSYCGNKLLITVMPKQNTDDTKANI